MKADDLVSIDPQVMGGTPVFRGTRVPVKTLFDYLANGYTLSEIVECFPTVRKQVLVEMLRRCLSVPDEPEAA